MKFSNDDAVEIPWLLILDSADGEDGSDIIKEYLPVGPYGSILITSRDSSFVPKYGGAVLGELGEQDASTLLLGCTVGTIKMTDDDREAANYDVSIESSSFIQQCATTHCLNVSRNAKHSSDENLYQFRRLDNVSHILKCLYPVESRKGHAILSWHPISNGTSSYVFCRIYT